jgi:hypothetical protein
MRWRLSESKHKCNHCNSENVSKQAWGRVEYYYCGDCKKEVDINAKKKDDLPFSPWTSWDPKQYGFSNSGQSKYASDDAILDSYSSDSVWIDDTMDLTKYFPGN